jgi:hypothetical protein
MKYFVIKAHCIDTNQTIQAQDLTGHRFGEFDRDNAEKAAANFADRTSKRTGQRWQGSVKLVTARN